MSSDYGILQRENGILNEKVSVVRDMDSTNNTQMKEEKKHLLQQMDDLRSAIKGYEENIQRLEKELEESITENMYSSSCEDYLQ